VVPLVVAPFGVGPSALARPHPAAHAQALRLLNGFTPEHERDPGRTLIHLGDHLAQMCIHSGYFGYRQWFLFDDVWAAAHPDLAASLIHYADLRQALAGRSTDTRVLLVLDRHGRGERGMGLMDVIAVRLHRPEPGTCEVSAFVTAGRRGLVRPVVRAAVRHRMGHRAGRRPAAGRQAVGHGRCSAEEGRHQRFVMTL
jgi:hypothetical protein